MAIRYYPCMHGMIIYMILCMIFQPGAPVLAHSDGRFVAGGGNGPTIHRSGATSKLPSVATFVDSSPAHTPSFHQDAQSHHGHAWSPQGTPRVDAPAEEAGLFDGDNDGEEEVEPGRGEVTPLDTDDKEKRDAEYFRSSRFHAECL